MNYFEDLTPRQIVLSAISIVTIFAIGMTLFVYTNQPKDNELKSTERTDGAPVVIEPMAEDISEEAETAQVEIPKSVIKASTEDYIEAEHKSNDQQTYADNSFKSDGVWYDDNYRYTWYSSNVLYHYRTPEWTVGADGIYRDADGYVVVASSDLPYGTIVEPTPFGACKVYDSGCPSGTFDVYTNF